MGKLKKIKIKYFEFYCISIVLKIYLEGVAESFEEI
ncbi:hypothetical protein NSB1T_11950 [Coprobacter fastidiosus NSB1 = JCM 33896]|nr:hypothetical protein NSB1T_11950 [Coprobacter fastidiosus NSB1 = JCM 33896]